jgi:hypothetical protein
VLWRGFTVKAASTLLVIPWRCFEPFEEKEDPRATNEEENFSMDKTLTMSRRLPFSGHRNIRKLKTFAPFSRTTFFHQTRIFRAELIGFGCQSERKKAHARLFNAR